MNTPTKTKVPKCPRCGIRKAFLPAMSRRDPAKKVCDECGTMEALFDLNITQLRSKGRSTEEELQRLIDAERGWANHN